MNLKELIEGKHISGVYFTSLTLPEVKTIASEFGFYVYYLRGEYIHDIQDFFNQSHVSFDFMLSSDVNWSRFRDYYDNIQNLIGNDPGAFEAAYFYFGVGSREIDHNVKNYVLLAGDTEFLRLSPDEVRIIE